MSTPGCTTNLGLYWNFYLTLLTHTTPSYTLLYDYNIPFSSSSDYKRVSLITFFGDKVVFSTHPMNPQTQKKGSDYSTQIVIDLFLIPFEFGTHPARGAAFQKSVDYYMHHHYDPF
jgi:hypothetical protein